MSLESGVAGYVKTFAVIEVNFPIDYKGREYMACIYCPYLSANQRTCQLNHEPVAFPERYVGASCPLSEEE